VSHLGAPPLKFIGVSHGVLGWNSRCRNLEPPLGTNEEGTRGKGKSVELSLVRPTRPRLQPTSPLAGWLTNGPSGPWLVTWLKLSQFHLGCGPFNPCDAECLRLIGQKSVALD
jgi:hypothetical protein